MRLKSFIPLYMVAMMAFSSIVMAAGDYKQPKDLDWPHEGLFGTYDQAAMQRGFQVYKQVCSACHGMDLVAYRNLQALGYSDAQVRAIAAEYMVTDGPNDEGEMFERPAIPADHFKNPYPNVETARYVNNGALPVDLSLIVKSRHYGEDYIYSLLSGYKEPPADVKMGPNMYYNPYFPGKQIAMAPPLLDGVVMYEDGTEATVEQMAKDVATFLAWASDPHMEVRKETGLKSMLFLFAFLLVMIGVKKKVWRGLKE